jgi:hypothetical protein
MSLAVALKSPSHWASAFRSVSWSGAGGVRRLETSARSVSVSIRESRGPMRPVSRVTALAVLSSDVADIAESGRNGIVISGMESAKCPMNHSDFDDAEPVSTVG